MDMARRCLRLAKKEVRTAPRGKQNTNTEAKAKNQAPRPLPRITLSYRQEEDEENEDPAESTSSKKPGGKIVARPVDGDRFRYSEEAQYVNSVRAWAINWIE